MFNWKVDDYFIEILRKSELFLELGRGFKFPADASDSSDDSPTTSDLRAWFDSQLGQFGGRSELDTRIQRFLHLHQA